MGVPGNANPLLLVQAAGAGGYQVERSLRFNSSDSAFLSRTPASAGNRKTWSLSFWIKFNVNSGNQYIFAASPDGYTSDFHLAYLRSDGTIKWDDVVGGSNVQLNKISNQVFRDFSAWYHFLFVVDTTNGTAANRNRLYVNGSEITWASGNNFTSNADSSISRACVHHIGGLNQSSSYLSAYLADIHFIDGQALDPTSFTEVSATTGQLVPKAYTGSFGTNGFWLKFSDNSAATATTLGKDYSGNNNNWSPSNLSVTAGAGNDSLVDTPTSYGTDTGAGGEVRGNYATFNPLSQLSNGATLSNGNLDVVTVSSGDQTIPSTLFVSSGKWYCEFTITTTNGCSVGIVPPIYLSGVEPGDTANSYGYRSTAARRTNATNTSYGATFTNGDIIGVALDLTGGTLVFYKNGVSQGTAFTGLNGTFCFAFGDITGGGATSCSVNFGQRAWAYTPPANHQPVVDTLLPTPVVAKPNTVMDVKLYTGNGSTQTISGLGFSPDLVWLKARSVAYSHQLYDPIRGATNALVSNTTAAEAVYSGGLTAFNSDGFTIGNDGGINQSSSTFVAWTWDAGSSTVTNTQGSITSQVRANASAGFSIVSWTGTGAAGSIGHGLNVAPQMVWAKTRTKVDGWPVYHSGGGSNYQLFINQTDAAVGGTSYFNGAPSSTVVNLGNNSGSNQSGQPCIAYCWAPVAGYSNAFSFVGNGSSDGPMIWLGFKPRLILLKRSDSANNWILVDTARDTYNSARYQLLPNVSDSEYTVVDTLDVLSNGFKLRDTNASRNASGGTYIGFAWAENPFQYARAR